MHFPEGHGGLGLSPKLQTVINERVFAAGGPNPYYRNPIGYGMCGPTVVEWGSDEQKQRYLRPLFTGEEVWCQLFSEPGSGRTSPGCRRAAFGTATSGSSTARRCGRRWPTSRSGACWSSAPTPEAVKHAGLTAFVVDMEAPGVEVRPLRQMTGEAEFNEVYFTDTRIADAEMLGGPGDGWRVSLTTLMNERVSIGGSVAPKGSGAIGVAVNLWKSLPEERRDPIARDELMRLWIRSEVGRLTNIRAAQNRKIGVPGPEGSIGKLAGAEVNKDVYELCVDLMGADGLLYGSYEMVRPEIAMGADTLQKAFLRSRANSIEGGTSEVMRNILGERVLGLPGDVRVDRDVPWSQVPRN